MNWDLLKEKNKFFCSVVIYFSTRVSALNLILAFLMISNKCVAKLSSLQTVTANTFSYLRFLRVSLQNIRSA